MKSKGAQGMLISGDSFLRLQKRLVSNVHGNSRHDSKPARLQGEFLTLAKPKSTKGTGIAYMCSKVNPKLGWS